MSAGWERVAYDVIDWDVPLVEYELVLEDTCEVCGCTDSCACPGGCWWVAPGLCSRCTRR